MFLLMQINTAILYFNENGCALSSLSEGNSQGSDPKSLEDPCARAKTMNQNYKLDTRLCRLFLSCWYKQQHGEVQGIGEMAEDSRNWQLCISSDRFS